MDNDRRSYRLLAQMASAAAVVLSLIFVGLEIRQSAEATRGATVLQLKENWTQLNMTMVQNPEIVEAFDLVLDNGLENVDRRSQAIVEAWWRTLMHNWSNAYYQFRIGTLDAEQWETVLRDMECEARYRPVEGSTPPLWDVWERNSYGFDASFQTLMDSVRAESAGSDEPTSCRRGR